MENEFWEHVYENLSNKDTKTSRLRLVPWRQVSSEGHAGDIFGKRRCSDAESIIVAQCVKVLLDAAGSPLSLRYGTDDGSSINGCGSADMGGKILFTSNMVPCFLFIVVICELLSTACSPPEAMEVLAGLARELCRNREGS